MTYASEDEVVARLIFDGQLLADEIISTSLEVQSTINNALVTTACREIETVCAAIVAGTKHNNNVKLRAERALASVSFGEAQQTPELYTEVSTEGLCAKLKQLIKNLIAKFKNFIRTTINSTTGVAKALADKYGAFSMAKTTQQALATELYGFYKSDYVQLIHDFRSNLDDIKAYVGDFSIEGRITERNRQLGQEIMMKLGFDSTSDGSIIASARIPQRNKLSVAQLDFSKQAIADNFGPVTDMLRYATSLSEVIKGAMRAEKKFNASQFRDDSEAAELWDHGKLFVNMIKVAQHLSTTAKRIGQQQLDMMNAFVVPAK